jgi:hypothetical protein
MTTMRAKHLSNSRFRPHRQYLYGGFRHFRGSGCYFNGFTQVCAFEPAWPLFFSAGFDWFPFGFGWDDGSWDDSNAAVSEDMITVPDESADAGNPSNEAVVPAQPLRGQNLDPKFFLLILKNGSDLVVTDYWLADGYIEYVGQDGAQGHIPVDALDLQETVRNNSARGLSFVLRTEP